jgi:hypothetical protein
MDASRSWIVYDKLRYRKLQRKNSGSSVNNSDNSYFMNAKVIKYSNSSSVLRCAVAGIIPSNAQKEEHCTNIRKVVKQSKVYKRKLSTYTHDRKQDTRQPRNPPWC